MKTEISDLRINPLYIYISYFLIFCLAIVTTINYEGNGYIYIGFTIISNVMLYMGFRKGAIFFDAFIGVLLWLGFWLKLSIRVSFFDGGFHEPVGGFDGSGDAFDYSLLVSSCGFAGLVIASYFREKFIFRYPTVLTNAENSGLFEFYRNYRVRILLLFVIMVLLVASSNAYFGIYQRGSIPRTILPYGLGGIYKWLLLFGLASFTAMILKFEYVLHKKTTLIVTMLGILEGFVSNLSLLSRGMVMNIGALGYGVYRSVSAYKFKTSMRFWVVSIVVFVVFFLSSVIIVNSVRQNSYVKESSRVESTLSTRLNKSFNETKILFLDRWVGIEGVMAITSSSLRGWPLWEEAWREKYSENNISLYDDKIITSPYRNTDFTKHHFVTSPGVVAFFYYPGSYLFLFSGLFFLGMFSALVEISIYRLGGKNLILCALLSQVVAYRWAHLGYVPSQSYLLFGALFLNLLLIYFANKFLAVRSIKRTISEV